MVLVKSIMMIVLVCVADSISQYRDLFRFDVKIAAAVAEETNLPFVTAENKFEALVILWVP